MPVNVPPVAADEPFMPVTVASAAKPPATAKAPFAPTTVPLVSASTSLNKPSGSADVPISTVGFVPPVEPPMTVIEIGIAPAGKVSVSPEVAEVPAHTIVADPTVGPKEI